MGPLSRRGTLGALVGLAAPTEAASAKHLPRPPSPRRVPEIPDTVAVPASAVVSVVSGELSGTNLQIANDIAAMFAAHVPSMRILPVVGRGSLQNLSDITTLRELDIGIAQSDVLAYLGRQASLAGLRGSVAYLAKLFDEEVHILARSGIGSVADLTGKRVNIDCKGSGTAYTARVIFEALDVKPDYVNDDQDAALRGLANGHLDALVYVTGKPARLFTEAGGRDLHLLALPLSPALLQTYLPARIEHADYPALVPGDTPVDTVAVGAVMAVHESSAGSRLSRFVDAFFTNLAALRTAPYHPKWQQVSLSAQVPGWSRFRAAQIWLDKHGTVLPAAAAGR